MVDFTQRRFLVTDRSYGSVLKRDIHQLARQLLFSPRRLGELDIVVSELVSNLVKHAQQGELLVRPVSYPSGPASNSATVETVTAGLELIAVDRGPGMADPGRMLQDGVSTTQTLGQGLGAINRLSDTFQLYSAIGWGTVLLTRLFVDPLPLFTARQPTETGAVVLPKPGQTDCGDGYAVVETASHIKLFLGDGLGHGPLAKLAVQQAIQAFQRCPAVSPAAILTVLHEAVKGTRGLVGTVVVFDRTRQVWHACGVGNISARISHALESKAYAGHNGIIGNNLPAHLIDQPFAYSAGQQLILYSDGLHNRWDAASYAGLFKYDPSVLAAALYKDQARQTDDISVLVGRIHP